MSSNRDDGLLERSQASISRRQVLFGFAGVAGIAAVGLEFGAAPAHASIRWVKPLDAPISYTQGFEGTEYPYSPDGRHKALDMVRSGYVDSPVYAMSDGVVLRNEWVDYLGNYLVLAYAEDYYSLYAHLKTRPSLSIGQSVAAGQRVATMGGTGSPPFDVHLHVELFKGRYDRTTPYPGGTRFDPEPIIRAAPYPSEVPAQPDSYLSEDDDMPAVIYVAEGHAPVLAIGPKFWAISNAEAESGRLGGVPQVWLTKATLDALITDARASKTRGAAPLLMRVSGVGVIYTAHGGAVRLQNDDEVNNLKTKLGVPEMSINSQLANVVVTDLRNATNA